MMGIDPAKQRDMMEESLEAILAPARRREPVELRDGLVQAGQGPPADAALPAPLPRGGGGGPDLAGRPAGRRALRLQPALHRGHLGRAGSTSSAPTGTSWRSEPPSSAPPSTAASGAWSGRCTSPTPRSRPSRTWGSAWPNGSTTSSGWRPCRWLPTPTNYESLVDALNASGFAVIGTVDDAIAQVERLRKQSKAASAPSCSWGTSGPTPQATRHSYELIARYVAPRVPGVIRGPSRPAGTGPPRTGPSSSAPPGTP